MSFSRPPYSCKILYVKGCIRITVTLHKIPAQLINFQPTSTHYQLDTLRSTKKYQLNFPYPGGITVVTDPEPEAVWKRSILTVDLVIEDWGQEKGKRNEILAIREKKTIKTSQENHSLFHSRDRNKSECVKEKKKIRKNRANGSVSMAH